MTLSVLYCPDEISIESTVDLIAVHGLGGDAKDTWTHPESKAFWLQDFLPQRHSDARIITFSYNAAVVFGESTAAVIDHAKSLLSSLVDKRENLNEEHRPLIFIAHSLGGIIVKEALLQARLEPRYQSIFESTIGLIFFGTPHRGSKKAVYGQVLSNVAQKMVHRPSSRLLAALKSNSDVLQRLTSDFRHQLGQYHVFSFYELLPTSAFSSLIVEKDSALLEIQHEEQIPINANHRMICKFETAADDTFDKVCCRIERMKKRPLRKVIAQVGEIQPPVVAEPLNKHFEVSYLLSPFYTGQNDASKKLHTLLAPGSTLCRSVQRRFVLFGPGGSGKTQICLKYAQTHREKYWGIFWIDASSVDSIQHSFEQIATALLIDSSLYNVKRLLTNTSHPWLLIFDNADNPELSLSPYFPAGDRGHIIITSRNPDCQQYKTYGCHEVGSMSPEDSRSLLCRIVYDEEPITKDLDTDVEHVAQALGRLPLALTQAGTYIREMSCTLLNYVELCQSHQKDLLNYIPKHIGTDYRYTVHTAWQLSLDTITSMGHRTSEHALELLALLCFYHHAQIPTALLTEGWVSKLDDIESSEALPNDSLKSQQMLWESVKLLMSFSLVTKDSDKLLSVHCLIQAWYREKMPRVRQQIVGRRALSILAGSLEKNIGETNNTYQRSLRPHIYACTAFSDGDSEFLDPETVWECRAIIPTLSECGSNQKAIGLIEKALSFKRINLGEDHDDTVAMKHELARAFAAAGRSAEAIQLTEEIMAFKKERYGDKHWLTLVSMHDLANRYETAGRGDEALRLREELLSFWKDDCGENHQHTVAASYDLAKLYAKSGQTSDALQLTMQALSLQKSSPNTNPAYLLHSETHLVDRYRELGRHGEALRLTMDLCEREKHQLGETHPYTMYTMRLLAKQQLKAGLTTTASQLYERVVALEKESLGTDHPDRLRSITELANMYDQSGRSSEAIQVANEAVQIYSTDMDRYRLQDVRITLNAQGNRLVRMQMLSEAVHQFEQIVACLRRSKETTEEETLRAMFTLANTYGMANRQADALEMMIQVVAGQKAELGSVHPDTLRSTVALTDGYFQRKRLDMAICVHEQQVTDMERELGRAHPQTLEAMLKNITLYEKAGQISEALKQADTLAILLFQRYEEEGDMRALGLLKELLKIYVTNGQQSEGLRLATEMLVVFKVEYGENHPATLGWKNITDKLREQTKGEKGSEEKELPRGKSSRLKSFFRKPQPIHS